MTFKVSIRSIFHCSLERAFKTPMLCDVSKVHTGFGLMPRVTHCTEDAGWGKPGGTKKVFTAASLTFAGGEASTDKVLERVENTYWKIEVSDFKSWMLGFYKFVEYTYTLHTHAPWLYPLGLLFAEGFWRIYMKRVLENVRALAYEEAPYKYE
jgi:hypothetical protein